MSAGAQTAVDPIPGGAASATKAVRARFGALADGTPIDQVTLSNANGTTAVAITLGATLQALHVADRDGHMVDVVLGYDDAASYSERPQYFGSTIGRCANRIAGARFEIDGNIHLLEANDGANHLHGGAAGFDRRVWTIEAVEQAPDAKVVMALACADGEGGYPGALSVTATYSLSDTDELTIAYEATATSPTIVNITNHSFFNLGGGGDVMDHRLTLHAAHYTPVDETLIPTGALASVAETPFDFRAPAPVGARIREGRDAQLAIGHGYDHHFVIDGASGELRPAARLEHEASGRVIDLLITAPGLQFYSGNFLDGSVIGKNRRSYRQGDGLCLEPQAYPDAANQPDFPSVRLDPGETYSNRMVLRFSTAPNPSAGLTR